MKRNSKIISITVVGMCTALICVLSIISVPMPSGVPITLQTFAIAFCGYLLTLKLAPVSVIAYIVLGTVGLPVFSGFRSGIGVLAGYTGGFIWGFIIMAFLCAFSSRFSNKIICILFGIIGLSVSHIFGVIQFSVVSSTPFFESFMLVSVPYIIKDIISVAVAYLLAIAVKAGIKKSNLNIA